MANDIPSTGLPAGQDPADTASVAVVVAPWQVAVVSGMILMLELAFIRLIPAEVQAISYFTNLVLMATFFGMGLGCILQDKVSLSWLLPAGMGLIAVFIFVGRGIVIYEEARSVHYWLQDADVPGQACRLPLFYAAAAAFVLSALPFVALGQRLALTMDRLPRLVAYAWNIAGSIAGTLLFVCSSLASIPPWVWPAVIGGLWSWLFLRGRLQRVITPLAGLVFLGLAHSPHAARWSPYYYIQHSVQPYGTRVWVNSSFHQLCVDFTADTPYDRNRQQELLAKWTRPYDWYRDLHDGAGPQRVLVLGAGTGNDVVVALQNEAERVVAVEIDPVILELGRTVNATDPYGDPRVVSKVDDARHFLRTSPETFDMVVFGTLDSQALLSSQANLRLENYVYTREALRDARRLLRPGGLVVLHYSAFQPWLRRRIYSTVRDVFGPGCRMQVEESELLFNTTIAASVDAPGFGDSAAAAAEFSGGLVSTDDWPFIYLRRPTVSPVYIKLLAVVLCLTAVAFFLLRRIHPVTGLHANFLFLGLGFTLMESSAIVRLALVFGSTWTVNAVVFSAVLATIFLGNLSVLKGKAPPLAFAWPGVLVFVLINFLFPMQLLFHVPTVLRVVVCGLLIGTPVFFASICFSRLFEGEPVTGYPLGVNLIGAMAGGTIEYASMAVGMRAIWLVVLAIYGAAWVSTLLIRRCGLGAGRE